MYPDGQVGPPRNPTLAHYEAAWERMMYLHSTQGTGYLAAFMDSVPQVQAYRLCGQHETAIQWAARALCTAAQHHAEVTCIDTAISVLQSALKECITTHQLELETSPILHINFELANMLLEAGEFEQALLKWRWLVPRSHRLHDDWVTGFHTRMTVCTCLMRLGRYKDAIAPAKEMYDVRVRTHGVQDTKAMDAIGTILNCSEQAGFPDPAGIIPLGQLYLGYLKRTNQGGERDEAICKTLERVHTCQRLVGDYGGAEVTCRSWVPMAKKLHGRGSNEHREVRVCVCVCVCVSRTSMRIGMPALVCQRCQITSDSTAVLPQYTQLPRHTHTHTHTHTHLTCLAGQRARVCAYVSNTSI